MAVTRFQADCRGATAVVFGLSAMVLMMAMGLAYDGSRVYDVNTKVQRALDAAALAAAKILDLEGASDSQVVDTARAYFSAHRPSIRMDGLVLGETVVGVDRTASTVNVEIAVSLRSLFGSLTGGDTSIDFVPAATATFKSKKIELSLVLDITGSMASSGKIDALKVAAKNLVDTLFAANPSPGQVRVALVPYSASVNAGSYFDAVTGGSGGGGSFSGWSSWSNWNGGGSSCVVERAGADAYTDAPPAAGNYLGTSNAGANPNYSCPGPVVVPLSDLSDAAQRANFKSAIDALTPLGGTAGHIGTAWGWYFLSDKWKSLWPAENQPKPKSPDIIKAMIIMTDGEFNTSYANGSVNSTDPTAVGSSGYQALQLCSAIASDNIAIYTVAFMAPASAETLLQTCSGSGNFYGADTSAQLLQSFQVIVDKLTSLRISS